MPFIVTSPDGRKLRFDGDEPPPLSVVEEAFRVSANPEVLEKGRLASAGSSFMRGYGEAVGDTLAGLARATTSPLQMVSGMTLPADAPPETRAAYQDALKANLNAGATPLGQARTQKEYQARLEQHPLYAAGQAVSEGARDAHQPNPQYAGEFFTDVLPSAGGGMVPTIAAGVVNPLAAALQYGLSAGESGAQEAIDYGKVEDADKVFLANMGIGAVSEFALGVPARLLKFVQRARKAGVKPETAGREWLKVLGEASVREGAQEGLEQTGQNIVARETYDPNRGVFEGVPTAIGAGMILGPVVGGSAFGVGKLTQTNPEREAGRALLDATEAPAAVDYDAIAVQQLSPQNATYTAVPSADAQAQEAATPEAIQQQAPLETAAATDEEARRQRIREMQINRERRRGMRPQVPVEGSQERVSGVEEIRRANARTIAQIQQLFPEAALTREQARVWRDAAWGQPKLPTEPQLSILPPTMDTARKIADMPARELLQNIRSFNDINLEIGRTATPNDVAELQRLRDRAVNRFQDARQRAEQTADPAALEEMSVLSALPQFYNEAIAEAKAGGVDAAAQPATVTPDANQSVVPSGTELQTRDSGTTAQPQPARNSVADAAYDQALLDNLAVALARRPGTDGVAPRLALKGVPADGKHSRAVSAAAALAARQGKRIVYFSGDGPRIPQAAAYAFLSPNVVFLNESVADNAAAAYTAHELTHLMQLDAMDVYSELQQFLLANISNLPQLQQSLGKAYTPGSIADEVVTHAVQDLLSKPDTLARVMDQNPSLWQRVVAFVYRALDRLYNLFAPLNKNSRVRTEFADYKAASQEIAKAFAEYKKRYEANQLDVGRGPDDPQLAIHAQSSRGWDRIQQPGISPEAEQRINQLRAVQSGDIDPDLRERITIAAYTEPTTRADRVTRALIKRTAELVTVSNAPLNFDQLTDPQARQEAAGIISERHALITRERSKIDAHVAKSEAAMQAFAQTLGKQLELQHISDFLAAKIPAEIKDYQTYLNNLAKLGPNESIKTTAQLMLDKAARSVDRKLAPEGAVANAIKALAKNTNIMVEESTTAKDILEQFWREGGQSGLNPEMTLLLFGEPSGEVVAGVEPLLSRIRNLPQIIDGLRVLESRRGKAEREVRDFQKAFNMKGQAVSLGEVMRRFASHVMAKRDADAYLRAASNEYEKLRAALLGGQTASELVNLLLEAPAYKQAVETAAKTINLDIAGLIVSTDGRHETTGPYPENKRKFIFELTPTRDAQLENIRNATELLTEIDRFINDPASDPLQRVSWENVGKVIKAVWLENIANPLVERKQGYRDPFDIKHWFGLWHARTLQGLFRDQIGGPETLQLRRNLDALDAIMLKMRALETNPTYGRKAITNRITEGAKSHGFEVRSGVVDRVRGTNVDTALVIENYRRDILNPIAASLQHHGAVPLRVGDYIPGTGYQVTKEDIAAVEAMHQFEQEVRRVTEQDTKVYGVPTKIADEMGEKTITRTSITTGPMMLTRYWSDTVANWVGQNWMSQAVGAQRDAQIAKLHDAMWNDPEMFRLLVLPYITTTNPEFIKRGSFTGDFRKLTLQMRSAPTTIASLTDLVEALAPMRKESRLELEEKLRKELGDEAVRIMDAMVKEVGQDLQTKDANIIDKAVYSSLRTEGSFLKPRGAMVGPDSFYQYAKAADSDIMKGPAVAITIARARALESMREVQAAYHKHQRAVQDEIVRAMNQNPSPKTRAEKKKQYDRDAALGNNRFTWTVLERRIKQIDSEIKKAEANLTNFDETFPAEVARTLTTLNRGVALQVLGGANSIAANLFGGTITNAIVVNTLLRKNLSTMAAPFKVSAKGMKVALAKTMMEVARRNPKLAGVAKASIPFADTIAKGLTKNMESTKRLIENSQIADFDWANKRKARKNVGFGGEILKPETGVPIHLRGMQWLYTTAPGMFQERFFPRGVDKLMNEINAHLFLDQIKDIASRAIGIGDVRVATGRPLDSADPKQFISHHEMEMGVNELMELRRLLEPVGSLESLVFDYYNRYTAAKNAGQPVTLDDVPFAPQDKMSAILLSYAKLGNVLAESNTPAFFKGNWIKRIFGTFGNWPANFFDQLAKLFPTSLPRSKAERDKVAKFLLATTLIVATSILFKEFKNLLQYLLTGKEAGEASLTNIADDPISADGARYLVGALAQGIPYLNLAVNSATDSGSMFDISKSVLLASVVKDTANITINAAKTGDVSKAFSDFSSRYLPLYSMALNRLPGFEEQIEAKNTTRAMRAATPRSIEMRSYGGGGGIGNPTALSKYMRQAETAAYRNDTRGARSALERAIQYRMRQGLSRTEAQRAVRQSLGARTPEMRLYGRTLTKTERSLVESRMTSRQRRSYEKGQRAYRALLSLAPKPSPSRRHSSPRLRALGY
jgi:hypothetical protein